MLVLVSCVWPDENAKIGNYDVVAFTISGIRGEQKGRRSWRRRAWLASSIRPPPRKSRLRPSPWKGGGASQPKVTAASTESLNAMHLDRSGVLTYRFACVDHAKTSRRYDGPTVALLRSFVKVPKYGTAKYVAPGKSAKLPV